MEIIKIETKNIFNDITNITLYGLNIFTENQVNISYENHSDVIFIKELINEYNCVMHLTVEDDDDIDIFQNINDIEVCDTNILPFEDNELIIPNKDKILDCYLKQNGYICEGKYIYGNHETLLQVANAEFLHHFVFYATMVLYFHRLKIADSDIKSFFETSFVNSNQWLSHSLDLFDFVITFGHDGQYINIYSYNDGILSKITKHIDKALFIIKNNSWFIENNLYLEWDDTALCLIDKNSIT